jgi:hypothetical protein
MTLHCKLHCPRDCQQHRNYPHYHPDHCPHTCNLRTYLKHIKKEKKEEIEEGEGEASTYVCVIRDVEEDDIRHDITCTSCGKEVIGPVYHRDPKLDYCQTCVQDGIPGAEFCIRYTTCCGYYGDDGLFSPWIDYI